MRKLLVIMLLTVVFIAGCTQIDDIIVVPISFVEMDDSGYTEDGYEQAVNANNKFAFDMYERLKNEGTNVFFSPYSISTALAMTYEGAEGKTAEEMADVFYFTEDDDVRRGAMAKMYNNINRPNKNYKLHTANAIWPSDTFPFFQEYFDVIDNFYGGEVTEMDYNRPEEAAETINDWVEDKTEDKIKDIVDSSVINTNVKMVLTNAIYFKGSWMIEFEEKDTDDRDFWINEDESVKVPTMYMSDERFNYMEDDEIQMLELPYRGDDISMLIILPKDDFDSLELSNDKLIGWKNGLVNQSAMILLPKFTFETKYENMGNMLMYMGMPTAFGPEADFSKMSEFGKQLFISDVIHQAFVEVNEEGTEAAAATVVVMEIKGVPQNAHFIADHPFLFLVQEKDNGNILFMGRVSDPR